MTYCYIQYNVTVPRLCHFCAFFGGRNYFSRWLIPTTITSQITYGMHKAGQHISGQLNTNRGTIECQYDQRNHASLVFHPGEGKFGWWIYLSSEALWNTVYSQLNACVWQFKLANKHNASPILALFILVSKWNYGGLFLYNFVKK